MKKFILSASLLIGISCFSQSVTKKYNSFYDRYEYFDPNGNMISYEKYNSLAKQWEMYNVDGSNISSNTRQPTQYRDPQQLSISGLGNAMTAKQNKYDNNVQQVQNTVNSISHQINNLNVTDEQRQLIHDTFQKSCVNEVNRTRINYSSANETNRVIQWLYDSVNTIIKNVTASSRVSSNNNSSNYQNNSSNDYSSDSKIKANYGRTLPVYNIAIFDKNNRRLKDETIITDSYVIINENRIDFKRADGFVTYRDFYNKVYNEQKKGYTYSSTTGAVFIHDDLKYIEFFTNNLGEGENYTYYITPSGNR
ncbi:hypothetical protein [Chryseobacterium hagamense]|uniref:Uncharacterized protein n=1 Tax=Chryseobacterium hagamense TaxID=395935 RepID=A0A511YQK1_9FLAO|nr:hypothetical protein [Chryseobacterium hagamense]GEN77470.1 hypothetical protein CHA01nite_32100 [Chryseobacterium hagamense]